VNIMQVSDLFAGVAKKSGRGSAGAVMRRA